MRPHELRVTINGVELTDAQAQTVRVAVTHLDASLDGEQAGDLCGLGDDEEGKNAARVYRTRVGELYRIMGIAQEG